jgi:hypothetical protein
MPQDITNAVKAAQASRSDWMTRYPPHFALAARGFGPSPERA